MFFCIRWTRLSEFGKPEQEFFSQKQHFNSAATLPAAPDVCRPVKNVSECRE